MKGCTRFTNNIIPHSLSVLLCLSCFKRLLLLYENLKKNVIIIGGLGEVEILTGMFTLRVS
jgi:hypothetical protein